MVKERYEEIKDVVLTHIQSLFDEMEESMAMSHQEKYTLLEDAFENASDEDELRVAFEQWYAEHAEDLDLGFKVDELWEKALGGDLNYDSLKEQNDEDVGLPKEDDNLAPKDEYKKDDYGDGRDDY